ncbi:PEP-utilizing enzyme [Actinomadura sp. ATCC 31491]|uniref:PEP-utilizing enzyme n=1 Tax=Actinomadura luzonensis TaxID=2805427 RepID=A0ABT0G620_9ACTN|nr:PEP/pyruvate-binding domain-containing protein [Actinomadura luzonensis]MCK2219959.1 PEP-utilizing enzyme [Actinomadura luzonensis]
MKLVAPLDAVGRDDLPLAGGKGANLGELVRNGFPVPPGFVVTTHAYELAAREDAGLPTDLPAELRQAITDAYAALGGGPVAVRSSATAEDLPGAAFAGQQDTYLNVVGEAALLDAVRRCWGSLWTERAIAYRARLGIDDAEVSIAVVVQRMVEPDAAGVLFTADPVNGERERIVVEAGAGLGEAVVSGLVTPDRYVVSRDGRIAYRPGRSEVVVRSAPGGGVVQERGSGAGQRLPDAVVTELAGLARRVAAHYGRPQDLEWAYAAGRLHLLQARPMTALPPPPVGRLNPLRRRLAAVLLEYLPVRPYPIDMTTWLPYGPAGLMGRVTGAFGIRRGFEGFLREEDGVVYALTPPSPRPSARVLTAPFRLGAKARRYDPARWTEDRRFTGYLAAVRRLAGRDLGAMPWAELIRVPRQALDLVAPVADLRIDYLPRTGLALLRLLVAVKVLGRRPLFGGLLAGAVTRTSEANRALERLAELAVTTGALNGDPAGGDAGSADAGVGAAPAGGLSVAALPGAFREAFEEFLREYGHRETSSPILVTPPCWADAPETVLGLVRMLAAHPAPPAAKDDALDRLLAHPLLRSPGRAARMRRWVAAARAGIAFREDSHFFFTLPQPVLRRALVELGRRLCRAGVLDRPEDVFHLRLEELEAVTDETELTGPYGTRLRAAARARAAKREELAGVRLIDPAAVFPPAPAGGALATGSPASTGTATGPVKVIRDPAEFGKLAAGDVLVCPYTNPSWTPLFQRAAAVVVDSGGAASHAAIVAREYGIPAVMGTGTGTSVLEDGQVVTVNGDAGTVVPAA